MVRLFFLPCVSTSKRNPTTPGAAHLDFPTSAGKQRCFLMLAGQEETERKREKRVLCAWGVRPPGRRRTASLPLSVVTAGVPPSQVASVYLLTTTAHHHYVTPTVAVGKELVGKIQGCRRLI
ncbi:hypothetical protein LXL04_002342 [Taraxacum kok-saghyz]